MPARVVVCAVTLTGAIAAVLLVLGIGRSHAGEPGPARTGEPDTGAEIWSQDCAICHGVRGEGSFQGPDITAKGTAAVDFMVRTGRMPVGFRPDLPEDAERGAPSYSEPEIRALVEHTAGFVSGPPASGAVDLGEADRAAGGDLYRLNCAACHQSAGQGGALAYGTNGPPLLESTPRETLEAMRTGPGAMPVFPESLLNEEQARDVVAYVDYLHEPQDPGGASLGHLGPVPEGLVAWIVGIGGALLLCRWLGERQELGTD